uniref:Interleukin-7 n=1 Tax=Gouania willdenowi TaxID=441366 RepID=A0A8C5GZN3_GOUWI
MPPLCSSLLSLLLLPLSLSCDTKRLPGEIRNDFPIVQTDLDNARESVSLVLQNSSCPPQKHKPRSCTTDNTDLVRTLHTLTCKMKHLRLPVTDGLVTSVLISIRCPCHEKTKESTTKSERRTETRQWMPEQRKKRREARKLCKAQTLLAAMSECYQMLNSQESSDT